MPARKATASGKWSQSIWDVTPGVGDDVFANGFTVEIDQNINVSSLRTTVSGSYAVAGGGFTLYQPLSVIASPNGFLMGSATCLTSYVSAGTAFLSGNAYSSSFAGQAGINHLGSGELNIFGDIFNIAATVVGNTDSVRNSSTGLIRVNGNVYGVINSNHTGSNCHAIQNQSQGTVIICGDVFGGNGTSANSHGVFQNSTGTVLVTGTITATPNAHGVVSANVNARNEFTGTLVNSISGRQAVYCAKYLVHPKMFDSAIVQAVDRSGTYVTYYAPEAYASSYVPHVSSVAVGTAYAAVSSLSGVAVSIPVQLSGTMVVPSAGSVSYGTLVGQTTGTAIHTVEQLQQVWNTNINTLTAENSLGARLKNTATVQEVGQQIQNLNL